MKKKVLARVGVFFVILIMTMLVLAFPLYRKISAVRYDIVIYGGGFAGCAAACSAALIAPGEEILLIVPDPVSELGGLGTAGGQNFTDIRYWQGELVTAGSFARWFAESGQFYNTREMAEILRRDLARFANVTVLYQHDLKRVFRFRDAVKVLALAPVERDKTGVVRWQKGQRVVWGNVFIDASDDGRLARLAGNQLAVGRQDWPKVYLPQDESPVAGAAGDKDKWARQQAATLMFQVRGIKKPAEPGQYGDLYFTFDGKGSWGLVGGKESYQNDPEVRYFNEAYQEKGFALKPVNAAQNGAGSDDWWVNMLLVFDVDGRAREMDRGSSSFPGLKEGQKTVDQAWQEARELLEQPEFLQALRHFTVTINGEQYGFGEAELVRDEQNKPVVGAIMYLRETVHSVINNPPVEGQIAVGNGNFADSQLISFALTTEEVQKAGAGIDLSGDGNSSAKEPGGEQERLSGADQDNYAERVGLAYYQMDINAYKASDLEQNGRYVWPVTGYVRPDWQEAGGQPVNPVYLPYGVLLPADSVNVLVPGYAANCSSLAWSEVRVLPNLAVLGDAAGVAAVRAVLYEENPADFGPEQLQWVQEQWRKVGVRLDK
jgi:hypothetical protein